MTDDARAAWAADVAIDPRGPGDRWRVAGRHEIVLVDGSGHEGVVVSTLNEAEVLTPEQLLEIGARADHPVIKVEDDFAGWAKHRSLRVVSFGNVLPVEEIHRGLRVRIYQDHAGAALAVVICVQYVAVEDFEPYAKILWRPGGALGYDLRGANVDRPLSTYEPLHRAVRVAAALEVSTRGRRPGDGALWASDDDFLDDLFSTLEGLIRDTNTPFGHNPVSRQFRSRMRGQPGESVLRNRLRAMGLRPKDFRSGAITRANFIQFTTK